MAPYVPLASPDRVAAEVKPTAFAHLADWSVIEDGEVIGRIYEVHAARSPEQAWFWSITALTPNPTGTPTNGHAPTFAKAQFQEHWFKAWKRAPA
jgi:hypothetical protein